MASFTMDAAPTYAAGSTVQVYSEDVITGGANPTAAALTSAVVGSTGTVTFTGLTEDTRYVAAQLQGSSWRLKHFRVSVPPATLASVESEVALRLAKGPIFEPEDFGHIAGTNMDVAVRAAISAAAAVGGGVVRGRPGNTYDWASTAVISGKHNVTLDFRGCKLKRVAGIISPDVATFGNWQGCDNLALLFDGGSIDVNNIERFGGFQINDCYKPRVIGVRADDSNLNLSWISYDHYLFVFNSGCVDVRMYDCEARRVELVEADQCLGFKLDRFYSEEAAGTVGIGLFTVGNNETVVDYEITNGVIVDAYKASLNFTHETTGPTGHSFKRIKVKDVAIKKLTTAAGVSSLLAFGNTGGTTPSVNTYEDIEFENLLLYVDPALKATGTATTVNGSPNLTLVTPTAKWNDDMTIAGTGIPANTTIVSGAGTASMVMSRNATASGAGVAITGYPIGRPLLYIIPAPGNDVLRLKAKNITLIGDPGPDQWAAEIRQATDGNIDKFKIRGATRGLSMLAPKDTEVTNLSIEASLAAYQVVSSRGGNRFVGRRVYGASTTPFDDSGLVASDYVNADGAVAEKTANYTMNAGDETLLVDASGGAVTITLPTSRKGHKIVVKKKDSSTNAVTVQRAGAETIEGVTSVSLASQYDTLKAVGNGDAVWYGV